MPLDPELVAETRFWLRMARLDHSAAEHELTATPPFSTDIVFHAQQEAEKTLKAFLTCHGTLFRKTHNLEEIGEQCLQIDESLRHVIDLAVPLTKYAWLCRYPGEPDEPAADEARQALALAGELYGAIASRLPPEARP